MRREHGQLTLIRRALQVRGSVIVRVAGVSMMPSIEPGRLVAIERRPFADVRVGEIVAFVLQDDLFVHRVAVRDARQLVTIGDNMPLYDPPVPAEAFLGCVAGPPAPPTPVPAAGAAGHADLAAMTFWCPVPPIAEPSLTALLAVGARLRVAAAVDVLERLGHGRCGIRVGVSAAGRTRAEALAALAAAHSGQCDVLVGYRFGMPRCGPSLLPPDAVDYHIRIAGPLVEVPFSRALEIAAAALRGHRRSPAAGAGARSL